MGVEQLDICNFSRKMGLVHKKLQLSYPQKYYTDIAHNLFHEHLDSFLKVLTQALNITLKKSLENHSISQMRKYRKKKELLETIYGFLHLLYTTSFTSLPIE